ncbi:hypothetical protein K3G63_16165 [Hymenobacter sp. HSC-4F20]|uniref:hypothetical protein n=1 Tax=Hymenobacter sp. HSC-4F20 TaxID=2864135 RepID=UPI001C72B409|nr:hypothetical protein [Hymenobacter sp. HSC-4F20]MBX0291988.1 hypothetical protein [Hymenobacter sp. HSC-4F20]
MQKMVLVVVMIVGWWWPQVAWATAQIPDILLYHGDTLYLSESPLEIYFEGRKDAPCHRTVCGSSSNWRCFRATWGIENQQLYLLAITPTCAESAKQIHLRRWFRPDAAGRVKASWVSGQLTLAEPASEVGMMYPAYLCQWHVWVQEGSVQSAPLPAERKLWQHLPLKEVTRRYCEARSLMTPEERHYTGIHNMPPAQVWVKIDAAASEPLTILAADRPELVPAALRVMRQYLQADPLLGSAQEQPWAMPLVFGNVDVPCNDD